MFVALGSGVKYKFFDMSAFTNACIYCYKHQWSRLIHKTELDVSLRVHKECNLHYNIY